METIDTIKQRRAVREYTGAPIERPTIERLIGAAILAPSAMNLQPWAFAALLDGERIGEYANRIKNWLLENFQETSLDPSLRKAIEGEGYSVFHGAPAVVLVIAKSQESQASEDCCLAAENLMLAARTKGSGLAASDWRGTGSTYHRRNKNWGFQHPTRWSCPSCSVTPKHGPNRMGEPPPKSIGLNKGFIESLLELGTR